MNRQPLWNWKSFWHCWLAGAIILVGGTRPTARAQAPTPQILPTIVPSSSAPVPNKAPVLSTARKTVDEKEQKEGEKFPPEPNPVPGGAAPAVAGYGVGCASCGNSHCIPGRLNECCGCSRDSIAGRLLCGFYEELCCPDPCYEGKWIAAANAAFFVEGSRPITTTRIRWDYANDFKFPDQSEFFWAKSGGGGGKGPTSLERSLTSSQLSLYQEIAAKGASGFIEIPYLTVDPEVNPLGAGFGDMKIGMKSLLFDRDMFQLGMMFKTYLPVGNFTKGLGTGHVSLEPSLLATLKIDADTFFQSQLSEWIPLGGDPEYEGSILHYHFSLNHVLWRPMHDVELIGTAEFTGYSFQAGRFTDPVLGQNQRSNGTTNLNIGPGLRLSVCEKYDFGGAAGFALGSHGPAQVYCIEFRMRF